MAVCELTSTCKFYNGKTTGMPANADSYKEKYCHTNNLHCAIYMIVQDKGPEKVPDDILPDQKDKAFIIISQS